jgi:hypothetical protein
MAAVLWWLPIGCLGAQELCEGVVVCVCAHALLDVIARAPVLTSHQ